MRIVVEGWRFVAHTYAIVNCCQLLEMLKRPQLELYHVDRELQLDNRRSPAAARGLFSPEEEERLARLAPPPAGAGTDLTFRLTAHFDFSPSSSRRTAVFAATEWTQIARRKLERLHVVDGRIPLPDGLVVVTPSNWSKAGLVASGIDPAAVAVVPHGVDPRVLAPIDGERRRELRRRLGWEGFFVFLNNSLMTRNKGSAQLLYAFGRLARRHPHARLAIKARDDILDARSQLRMAADSLSARAYERLEPRLLYFGETMSFARVAELYQAADAYVAPYLAEGFNLPALEAAACGLPLVCTAGGPTDDFTTPEFALRIASRPFEVENVRDPGGAKLKGLLPDPEHLAALMMELVENGDFARRAREAGPRHVHAHFTWAQAVDRLLAAVA